VLGQACQMDEAFQQAVDNLESVLAENQKHIFRATVLDRDNQLVATGEALLVGGTPIFWPDEEKLKDIQPSNAVILRHSDGTETSIADFRLCAAMLMSVHYHFRVV